ncbi:hypothetical protein ES288_A05G396200v1 [Gossypium darwinii]|uniref:Retrotransposon gag domain-containing protein n=1 Tax=Gossypium darwinii TaxID=34276 RepID=A0A5D2GPV8_GOSDA|nr:hypothetical protein ES288_A05G396200v1 [Gossypium darwinii]
MLGVGQGCDEEGSTENLPDELGEQSNIQVAKDHQPTINKVITTNQLKELIKEVVKDQVDYVTQPSYTYTKSKFQQYDGKRNPHQHVSHFVETYNNSKTYGDLMVKQFVQSLKGNTFEWYTNLELETISS